MNTRSHFSSTLNRLIEERGITQIQLAKRTGIDQSVISRVIAHSKRPPDAVGRAICSCWPDPEDNFRLLIEGLRDQAARWGFDPHALEIRHKTIEIPETQPEKDLETIRRHLSDKNIASMVKCRPNSSAAKLPKCQMDYKQQKKLLLNLPAFPKNRTY